MAWQPGQRITASRLTLMSNPVHFYGYSSTGQSIPNNSLTQVTFDTKVIDTHSGLSTFQDPDKYFCQVAGTYVVSGLTTWPASNTTGLRMAEMRLNGSIVLQGSEVLSPPISTTQLMSIQTKEVPVVMAIGDYVSLSVLQTSGGSITIGAAGGGTLSTMVVRRVSD
jgi:hypothetical protein